MSNYQIEVELFKGEEPVDFPEDCNDDRETLVAIAHAQVALDKGKADKVVVYISKDDELLEIITETKDTFVAKEVVAKIREIKREIKYEK